MCSWPWRGKNDRPRRDCGFPVLNDFPRAYPIVECSIGLPGSAWMGLPPTEAMWNLVQVEERFVGPLVESARPHASGGSPDRGV